METPPQIQSIISSKNVSSKSAVNSMKSFLATQKSFFLEHETDVEKNHDESTEDEYFNMDDNKEDKLGYEEFEQRLNAMIESLSDDYFLKTKKKSDDVGSSSKKMEHDELEPEGSSVVNTVKKEDSIESNEKEQIKEEMVKPDAGSIKSSPSKHSKSNSINSEKERRKEMKKVKKREEKEAKRAKKKMAKEAKKADKEKEKKIKKEQKHKRKRIKTEDDRSSKRSKI